MAEAKLAEHERVSYERELVPSDAYRDAVLAVLGLHALPVWGWGQRDAYARGSRWKGRVSTTGFARPTSGRRRSATSGSGSRWSHRSPTRSVERKAGSMTSSPPQSETLPHARSVRSSSGSTWCCSPVCVDGIGEEMVRTVAASNYGPLERHARRMVMYKRGQCADGCDSLSELVTRCAVRPRLPHRSRCALARRGA